MIYRLLQTLHEGYPLTLMCMMPPSGAHLVHSLMHPWPTAAVQLIFQIFAVRTEPIIKFDR